MEVSTFGGGLRLRPHPGPAEPIRTPPGARTRWKEGAPLRVGDIKSAGKSAGRSAEPSAGTEAPALRQGPGEASPLGQAQPDQERLARHLRNLGRMYPVLGHDLHAFLNTMVLNLELLQRAAAKIDGDAETAARIRRYAALVADEIPPLDRMLRAVVGQLRLSDPPTTRFDFRALCEELAIVLGSYARYRRLLIQTTLADVPIAVAGDRDAVAHALTSLFVESLDAMPQGSTLTLSLQTDRRHASLILAAEPPASFERDPAPRELPAAAREILESHGARVLHTSGSDGSSALDITLPLAPLST